MAEAIEEHRPRPARMTTRPATREDAERATPPSAPPPLEPGPEPRKVSTRTPWE